jgi:hypothetical protein
MLTRLGLVSAVSLTTLLFSACADDMSAARVEEPEPPAEVALTAFAANQYVTSRADMNTDYLRPAEGSWGTWSSWQFCSPGSYANGFYSKVEAPQHGSDDTALNAIMLDCNTPDGPYTGTLLPAEGPWGNWGLVERCPPWGAIIGAYARVESPRGSGDDTAMNALRVTCDYGTATNVYGSWNETEGPWGEWGDSERCTLGSAVCGMQVRIEAPQGKGDDTAMNGVRFRCCWQPGFPH